MIFQTFYFKRGVVLVLPIVLILASCGGKPPQAEAPVSSPASVSTSPIPKATIAASPVTPATTFSKPIAMAPSTHPSGAIAASTLIEGEIAPEGTACPSSAPIKGKDSKHGKIYHLPQTNNYEQVKPTVCFTDVAAATKAGYRAPKQP